MASGRFPKYPLETTDNITKRDIRIRSYMYFEFQNIQFIMFVSKVLWQCVRLKG